jgi:hypothetical protein
MPQIVRDLDNNDMAYCDCPGFSDNRGAEINIANAINTRRVLVFGFFPLGSSVIFFAPPSYE